MKIFTKMKKNSFLRLLLITGLVYAFSLIPQILMLLAYNYETVKILFYPLLFSAIAMTWYVGVKLEVLSNPSVAKIKKYVTFENFIKLISAVFMMYLISIAVNYVLIMMGQSTETSNQEKLVSIASKIPISIFIGAVASAGFFEEIIFRKVIYDYFSLIDWRYALLGTSCLFSFIHSPNSFASFIIYLSYGMWLGFIRYKEDTIISSIAVHIVWNILGTVVVYS